MNRTLFTSLSTIVILSSFAPAPAVQAEPTAIRTVTTSVTQSLSPFSLVQLASQGYLKAQGIPSNVGLFTAYAQGDITAQDVVTAAIAADRLPASALNDKSYLNAVETQLQGQANLN